MSLNGCQVIRDKVCISTGGLNAYLPAVVAANDLVAWGFEPHERVRAGMWWRMEDQVPAILDAMIERINAIKASL